MSIRVKGFLFASAFLMVFAFCHRAAASEEPMAYVGAMMSSDQKKVHEDLKNHFASKDGSEHFLAGYKFFPWCGSVEAGYTNFHGDSGKNIFLDMLGYAVVTKNFKTFLSAGLGKMFNTRLVLNKGFKATPRVGGGVQLAINDVVSARVFLQHQNGGRHVKHFTHVGAGFLVGF